MCENFVVNAIGLTKTYGSLTALEGVDLQVKKGSTVGVLGLNGAGKTTLLEIITGSRKQDHGTVSVAGFSERHLIKKLGLISIQPQESALFKYLTVKEMLQLWEGMYSTSLDYRSIVKLVGLDAKVDSRVSTLSGGQRQRLRLGLALIGNAEVTLLDEPTVGLDPIGRDLIWEVIKNRSESGTVLLSTQYMYEAEYLCDEIVILDHGTVIAKGTPKKLLEELGGKVSLSFKTKRTGAVGKVSDLPGVVWVGSQRIGNSLSVKLLSDDQAATLIALRREISDASSSITIKAPTLDDVFQRVVAKGGIDLK